MVCNICEQTGFCFFICKLEVNKFINFSSVLYMYEKGNFWNED